MEGYCQGYSPGHGAVKGRAHSKGGREESSNQV